MLGEFTAYCRTERRYSDRTTDLYLHELAKLERFVDEPFLSDRSRRLSAGQLRSYIAGRSDEVSLWALRSTVKAAKCWERFGGIAEWWVPNGILHIQLPMPQVEPRAPLSDEEIRALWDACESARQVRVLGLGLFAATRITEAIRVGEAQWEDDRLRFVGKGGRVRKVPLHPELASMRNVILGESVTLDKLRKPIEALREKSGVERFVPHLCRHTFSTRLLDAGVALPVVEALMGHSHGSTTLKHYAAVPWADQVKGIAELPFHI